MRQIVLLWMGVWACSSVSYAVWDYTIGDGQYEYGSLRLYDNETLLVTGGGAYRIEAFDSTYVEVQATTPPLQVDVGGINSLNLRQNSTMNYYGGETSGFYIYENASAVLRGGSILHISSYQDVSWWYGEPVDQHIEMIVRVWSHDVQTNLLTGTWNVDNDNDDLFDTFSIQLHDQAGYDKAIDNIMVTIIPDPATLLLFGLGGWILRKPRASV